MTMSLPGEMVDEARREREAAALGPITSNIDRLIKDGMSGIDAVAKGAAEQMAPVAQLFAGGELKLPTLDELTPEWMRPKPVQAAPVQPAQPGMQMGSVTLTDGRQQQQPSMRPGESVGNVEMSNGGGSLEDWARSEARRLRIDPEIAVRVAMSEGGFSDPVRQSDVVYQGEREQSYGPYQLNVTGGLGTQAIARGIDPRRPENARAAVTYALEHAARNGWGNFHGAAQVGIGQWDGIGVDTPAPAAQGPRQTTPVEAEQTPAAQAQVGRPTQFAQGLSWEESIAACGLAGVAWFTQRTGRTPATVAEVKQAAEVSKKWDAQTGMYGAEATASLLRDTYNIPAVVEDGVDWAKVRRDVLAGNPVMFDTTGGSNGHYYTVSGARQRADGQWEYDLDTSATDLRASQGRRWYTADEVVNLGFGAPHKTIYVNNPNSPTPSVAVSLTATPPSPSGESVAAPSPAAAGASPPPAAAPPAPWANETGGGPMMMKADESADFLPGDGGYAPQVQASPDRVAETFDPDQGAREAIPGSVGSQPLPQTNNPMTYGPIQQSDVAEGPPTLGDITYQNGGEPTGNGPWTEMPVRPLEAQQPANEQASASPGSITDHLGNVLLPVLDSAGQIVSYVQQQARQLGRQIAPRGNPVANVAQGLTPGGQTYGQAVAPIMNPRRETNVAPEAFIRDAMDVGQNAPKVPAAIDQKITEIANEARSQFQQAGQAYDEGRMGEAVLNGVMGALNVVGSPWTVAAEGIDTVLPTMEANSALSMGDAITNADLIRDARMIAQAVAKLVRAGVRVTPEIVAALRSGAAVEDFLNGAAGAIDRGIEAVAPVARRAGELASDVGAGIGRGVRSVAEEAAYQATFGPRSMAQNIVPPGVADEMGATFPVRVPTDPKAIRAIEAIGGTVDPQRGVTINVTRAQGPQAAGMPATRGGVFYEAVPEGGRSNFVRGSDDPTGVGGSQVIPATPTRFRSPLIVSDAPGGSNGFEESMRQMGVENPVHGGPVYSWDINDAIRQARAAGPEGSEARADALREVVRRFGGDEDLIEPLLRVRGADASESEWAIRENILAAHARRNGYDGVVTVETPNAPMYEIMQHPAVVEAKAARDAAYVALQQATARGETGAARKAVDDAYYAAQDALEAAKDAAHRELYPPKITELMDVREGANPTPSPTRNPALVEAEQALATAEDEFNRAQAAAKKIWQSGKRPTHEQNIWLAEQYEYVDTLRRNVNELNRSRPTVGDPGFSVRPDIQRPPGAQWAGMPFDPASAAMGGAAGAASEDENGDSGDPLRTLAGFGFAGMAGRMARKPGKTFAFGAKPGERLEFNVRVVPLRDLITSHLDNLAVNRAFPGALQPRVRERAASRVQIDKMVQAFDPEQVLMDTHRVDSGPMIVGPDMVVESGNGRGIALRRLSQENPEAYANYVQALREELPYYGLTEDALKGIDQPVLVRERITPMTPEERARYAADANVGVQARMAPVEQAMQDAGRISDDAVSRIVVGEDQTIDEALMAAENGGFRRAFMASVPESEWGELLTADGNLNPRGLARVKDALLAKTYQGSAGARLATAFVDSLDSGIKNVQHGIMGSLPTVARAEARIAAGELPADLSIANDMAVAADVYSRLRRRKTILKDYIAQSGMFDGRETTPFQDKILAYLDENSRSPKRIRAMLDEYARTVDGMAGSEQTDMFGLPIPQETKEEVLDGVIRRLSADADQGADLGRTGTGSNVVEGAGPGASQLQDQTAGAAPSGAAGSGAEAAAGPQLTAEEQLARFQQARGQQPAAATTNAPQPLRPANLPPVADDLIPATGGEAGALQVEGAPQPIRRPAPVGDVLPATGGPEGVLRQQGAPEPLARPGPVADIVPRTGGEAGTLAQEGAPTPLARPTPIPRDVLPSTGGPEGGLRVQEDARAVEDLMENSRGARRYDDQQRRQISDATARYAEDVRVLSQRIAAERAAGTTPDRLLAERAAVASRLHATMQLAEGNRGSAIRAFREYDRQAALLKRDPNRAVEHFYKKLGGRENAVAAADEYTKMVEDGANPVQLAKFWALAESGKITGADLFGLYRRFNMLSGPRTIEVNALSGATNLAYEVLSQAGGQLARGRGADAASEVAAPFKAMGRAFGNLAETMRHGVTTEQAARGDIPRTLSSRTSNPVAKGVLTAMEMPDRFNAAVDQFFRTMTEDWAATTLAHKQARAAGVTPRSPEWAETVAKNLEAVRDDVDAFPEIKRMADHVTFSEEPGGIGRGLEEFRRRAPLVANILFPFIRTPYNIASRAVDISPLGVVRTGIEAATGRGRGRENISRRVRDNALGLAAAYWAYDQATLGNVTGAGPDDPEKQAMLRATGWQPYSIKVGDRYWSYANFAPFSLALSLGAAAHEAKQYAKPGEADTLALLGDAATRTAKVVTDMTVLQGIGAVIKSIQDPDRYGGAWLTQFLSTLIPAGSLLNTVGQATDDAVRRSERDTFANQVSQGVQARIPGLRQGVPAAQDPLGRTVPNEQQGAGALNPFRPTTRRNDPAIQAFLDAGVDIGKPKDKVTVVAGAAPIELTPAEQRRWSELRGAILVQNVPNVAGSQRYQEAEKLARAKGLQTMLNAAAQAADKQLIAEIGGDEIKRRLTGAIEKRRAS